MTKREAIERMISEFNAVPQQWVKIVAESEYEYPSLPMWGTMWIVDRLYGEKLMQHSRKMVDDKDSIDLLDLPEDEREKVAKAIEEEDYLVLEDYIDEEMDGSHCVLDVNGEATSIFIYDVLDEYVIGVDGAGWNFYDGVWNKMYDLMGLKWHDEEIK